MTVFVDDVEDVTKSKSQMKNKLKIKHNYQAIVVFQNSNGLEVNAGKTCLTEYMTHQKRVKIQGIPPELTVMKQQKDKLVDSHITDGVYSRFLGANLNMMAYTAKDPRPPPHGVFCT